MGTKKRDWTLLAEDEELGLAVEGVVEVGQEQALASARPLTLAGSPQSVSHLPRKHSLAFDQPPAGQPASVVPEIHLLFPLSPLHEGRSGFRGAEGGNHLATQKRDSHNSSFGSSCTCQR